MRKVHKFNNIQQQLIILFKMNPGALLIQKLSVIFWLIAVSNQQAYFTKETSYRNRTWMSSLDYGLPVRQISLLGTHNSVGFQWCFVTGGFQQTQSNPLNVQLESGIRALDIRVKHKNDKFQVYDRSCNLGYNFDQILTVVRTFLASYASQTVLLHLVEQQSSSGCTRSFQDTFKSYRDAYPGLFWTLTTQDPQLGQVRGKILLIQQFNGAEVYGLLWATFSVLPNKKMGTNWNLYDKWSQVKSFMLGANAAKKSKIAFWTGNGGSYPYFVASGKSSLNGNRLLTGMTTPGWKNSCKDFPRVGCFIGICSIVFEGINILGLDYISNQNFAYTGIVYTDFYGDDLLRNILGRNTALYAKCSLTQVSQGCTLCQLGTGICLKCNKEMHYIYNAVNKDCLAEIGHYLDVNYIPQLCYSTIPGCLECTSETFCSKCDQLNHYILQVNLCIAAPGYYLDASFLSVACPQTGCSQCSDEVNCTMCTVQTNYILDQDTNNTCKCDDINHFRQHPSIQSCICQLTYFLTPNETCDLMPRCPANPGCLNCNANICMECDVSKNYVLDPNLEYCECDNMYFFTGNQCLLCNTIDAACDQCANAQLCLSCLQNFTLVTGQCICQFQHYQVDKDTCEKCSVGCLVCNGIGQCSTCDSNNYFILVAGFCPCVSGRFEKDGGCYLCNQMKGCIDCDNAGCTVCQPLFGFHLDGNICECDYGYFINQMRICEKCMMDGCLNCISQDQCIQCNATEYFLTPDGYCDDICGDGIRIYAQCDDGNSQNGDGCSDQCKIQVDYKCTGGSRASKDICSYSGSFHLTILFTSKEQRQNKVHVQISIKPNIMSLKMINFTQSLTPAFSYSSKQATFIQAQGKIIYEFTYNSSLNSLTSNELKIQFQPPNSQPQTYYMQVASVNMPEVSDNNLALKFYDQSIYGLLDIMKTLTTVAAFLYVGVFLVCFVFVSKLIAIELILVPQIAFAGLIMIEKIQSLLQPLSNFRIVNGYNPLFTDSMDLPPRILTLNYGGYFLANFNICLVIIMLPLLVGVFLLILGRAKDSKRLRKCSYRTLKQWGLSIILVFQFQFTISFGIDLVFRQDVVGKIIGGLLILCLVCLMILIFKKPMNFGEFKSYFLQQPRFLNHYVLVVLFRMALALILVIMSSNPICGFVAIGITGLYTLVLIILRPYLKNVRPILNMLVVIAILVIQSIYKMNFYQSDANFITSYLPIFIVILLLVLLLANVIFMILQVRQRYLKKQINQYQKEGDPSMDLQLKKQLERQMQVINQIQISLNPINLSKIRQKDSQDQDFKKTTQLKHQLKLARQATQSKYVILEGTKRPLTEYQEDLYMQI